MMRKHGPRAIKEFTSVAFRQFGIRVVVLAAFMDSRDPSILLWVMGLYSIHVYFSQKISNSFDYNDANGGPSFKARHKDWRQYQIMEDFSKWGAESFSESTFRLKENTLMR